MPKVVDHQQRQAELAEAAFYTVAKLGFAGTTMRSLAHIAGCSTGALVHYYKNKEDILEAALNFAHQRTTVRMRHLIDNNSDNLLFLICQEALPTRKPQKEEWKVWTEFWGYALNNSKLKRTNKQRYQHWLGGLRKVFEISMNKGEVAASIDCEAEAAALAALIDGIGMQATLDPQRLTLQNQLAIIQHHLDGLRP